jgi:putative ABC transport system substrate-binding protein
VQVLSRWRSSEPHRPRVMRSCPRGHQRSVDRGAVAVTGFWSEGDESLIGKRLELLKHAAPHISRVGVMVNPDDASDARPLDALPAAARTLGLAVRVLEVRTAAEFEPAFAAAAREGLQGLHVSQVPLFNSSRTEVITIALSYALTSEPGKGSNRR